jgi:Pentapeptide repeats (8 copies)
MDSNQLKERYKAGERNFREVSLPGASLVWFELPGIDLRGADLSHANLSGANLSEANLSEGTNLSFADLSRTDLSNANLKGANLEGANLAGAVLEGAVYNPQTKFPRGFDPARVGAIATGNALPAIADEPPALPEEIPSKLEPELEQYIAATKPQNYRQESKGQTPSAPTKPQQSHPTVVDELAKQVKSAFNSLKSDWNQVSPSDWTIAPSSHQAFQPFQVGNTSGLGSSSIVPKEIKGWNWGAFLLPWGWFLTNRVWGGFWIWILCLIPQWGVGITVLYALLSASKGNEWAWKSRQWESIAAFKKHQLFWAIAGFIFWGCMIFAALSKKG